MSEEEIKVILIGESGTGKTSLINATMGLKFKENMESTTTNSFSSKKINIENKEYVLNIWDTIGQEKFRSLTKIFIKDSKIVILVYDITRMESFKELNFWYKMIHDILGDDVVLGICGNKQDLFVKEQVKEEEGKRYAADKNIPFKLTSAKNPLSFNKFLEELVKLYIEKTGGVKDSKGSGKINLNNSKKGDKKKCCQNNIFKTVNQRIVNCDIEQFGYLINKTMLKIIFKIVKI